MSGDVLAEVLGRAREVAAHAVAPDERAELGPVLAGRLDALRDAVAALDAAPAGEVHPECEAVMSAAADMVRATDAELALLRSAVREVVPAGRAIDPERSTAALVAELRGAAEAGGWQGRPPLGGDSVDNLLCCTVRYALGRATYVVAWVVDLVVAHEPWLTDRARSVLVRDIRQAFEHGATGMDMDTDQWRRALAVLDPDRPEPGPAGVS